MRMTKLPKNKDATLILSFEIIKPTNEIETEGEILELSQFGEYCPNNSLRGYSLLHLIQHPDNYKIKSIINKGIILQMY
jgi:hypothetical protein